MPIFKRNKPLKPTPHLSDIYPHAVSDYLGLRAANAQDAMIDIVHLKNGSVIRGIIIEQVINKAIKLETSDKSIFVFEMDDIEKLTKERVPTSTKATEKKEEEPLKPKREIKQKGYTNITELNFGFQDAFTTYGFHTINGYLVNPIFSVGLGVGIEAYPSSLFRSQKNTTWAMLPMFIDARANFINGPITPFLSFGAGYSIPLDESFPHTNIGGILINPSVGVKFFISKSTALNFSLGYRFQELGQKWTPYYYQTTDTSLEQTNLQRTELHFVSLKVGVTF